MKRIIRNTVKEDIRARERVVGRGQGREMRKLKDFRGDSTAEVSF